MIKFKFVFVFCLFLFLTYLPVHLDKLLLDPNPLLCSYSIHPHLFPPISSTPVKTGHMTCDHGIDGKPHDLCPAGARAVFLSGVFAGLCYCITHPIESVKTRVQVMSAVKETKGFFNAFLQILKTEGMFFSFPLLTLQVSQTLWPQLCL